MKVKKRDGKIVEFDKNKIIEAISGANSSVPRNERATLVQKKEIARLEKEKAKVQKDIDFLSGKLNNQGFIAKAPAQLIEANGIKEI